MHRAILILPVVLAACGGGRAADPAPAPAPARTTPAETAARLAEPSTLRYAAGTGRYRVESVVNSQQETMGNTQEATVTTVMIMSTVMTEESGQLVLAATLDSVSMTGGAPGMDANALNSARGRTFRARFTPQGRPIPVTTQDSSDLAGQQLTRGVREFLAVLPTGNIAAGTTWTDTVAENSPMPAGAGSLSIRSIRNHRVVGWDTRDGARALRIATSGNFTISGSGEVQGAAVEMNGTGAASADRWISSNGVYLGSTGTDTTNLTVNVTSVGMTIPIRQIQRTTVTRLP